MPAEFLGVLRGEAVPPALSRQTLHPRRQLLHLQRGMSARSERQRTLCQSSAVGGGTLMLGSGLGDEHG